MKPVRLGYVEVVSTLSSHLDHQPELPKPATGIVRFAIHQLTLAEAKANAPFNILVPSVVPEGWKLVETHQAVGEFKDQQHILYITLKYKKPDSRSWFVIQQFPSYQTKRLEIPAVVSAGWVGTRKAALFKQVVEARDMPSKNLVILHCLWEQEGLLCDLQSPWLAQEVMKEIAASVM